MSAFIVSHDHIDALLTFASERINGRETSYYVPQSECNVPGGKRVDITWENATEIGRILLTENERSVRYRYPDCDAGDLPGTIGDDAASYRFRPWSYPAAPLTAVAILNGCSCFDYQACETPDYRDTLASRIIEAIRKTAIHRLPGYDTAPGWEFDRAAKARKRA